MRLLWICLFAALAKPDCASDRTLTLIETTERSLDSPEPDALPAPAPDSEPDLAAGLTRGTLQRLAVLKSPRIAAATQRARALLAHARAERSLPPPMLELQIWNVPLERPWAAGEADMIMLELSQTFPAAGARDGRALALAEEAQALLAELTDITRALILAADEAFADYRYAGDQHQVHSAHAGLLARMRRAALVRTATHGGLAEVTRVDLESARLQGEIARLEGERRRAASRINAFLGRASDAALGAPAAVSLPEDVGAVPELIAEALEKRGEAQAIEARIRAARARLQAAEAEASWPEFRFGGGYWQDPDARPGFGLGFAMTLPWLTGGGEARVDAERASLAAEEAEKAQLERTSRAAVGDAWSQWQALATQRKVLVEKIQPAAMRAARALESAYVAGQATLIEWLDASRALLDAREQEVSLDTEALRALIRLEHAVGRALTTTPEPTP